MSIRRRGDGVLHGCPCGYHTDPRRECHCTPHQIQRYLGRISGPLLDRIDIHVDVPAVPYRDLKIKRRKLLLIALCAFTATSLLYLWLPFRVAVVQIVLRLGGGRMMIGWKYKPFNAPRYVPLSQAHEYPPDAEALGLELNGVAKAIPVKRIAWHLMVNDEIGGEPVVVTLCTVSDAAFAYRARCGKQTLRFAPVTLARNNLVMQDEQTRSRWQQFTGEAISGPLSGSVLEPIPLERVRLEDWTQRHRSGMILEPACDARDCCAPNDTCPVMSYFPSKPFLLQRPQHEDDRLPRKQRVVGMVPSDGSAATFPAGVQAGSIKLTPVREVTCYWFAWAEFHPGAEIREPIKQTRTNLMKSDNVSDRRPR